MTNSKKKHSIKTAFSDTNYENENKNYDIDMINKYEKNLINFCKILNILYKKLIYLLIFIIFFIYINQKKI